MVHILVRGDVAGDRVELPAGERTIGVPLQPLVRAILAAIAILEEKRAAAMGDLVNLGQCGGAVVGVEELEEMPAAQFHVVSLMNRQTLESASGVKSSIGRGRPSNTPPVLLE